MTAGVKVPPEVEQRMKDRAKLLHSRFGTTAPTQQVLEVDTQEICDALIEAWKEGVLAEQGYPEGVE